MFSRSQELEHSEGDTGIRVNRPGSRKPKIQVRDELSSENSCDVLWKVIDTDYSQGH